MSTLAHSLLFLLVLLGLFANPATAQAAETVTYYHTDALGSPVAATDESGNLVWRETYRPYGERLNNQSTASDNPIWYTGKRQDAETGLVYMGSRYYDPRLGRFLSIDPVEPDENNLHSLNRYAYANNNPYKFTDPDGQAAETVIDVVSLGLSINAFRQDPGFVNGLAVAYDGLATAVPFLPGGIGIIRQGASKGGEVTQALKQAADRGAAKAGNGAQKSTRELKPDFIVSSKGTAMPTNKDFNLVDSKKPGDWLQIHNTHADAKAPGISHTHFPRRHNQSTTREIRTTSGSDIDKADGLLRSGQMRERLNRTDKGGELQ